jgi:hypothetical protein
VPVRHGELARRCRPSRARTQARRRAPPASRPLPAPRWPRAHAARRPTLTGRPFFAPRSCRGGLERRAAIRTSVCPAVHPQSPGTRIPEAPPCIRWSLGGPSAPIRASLPRSPTRRPPTSNQAAAGALPPTRAAATSSSFPFSRESPKVSSTLLHPNRSSPARPPGPSEPSSPGTAAAAAAFTGRRRAACRCHHRPVQHPKPSPASP